MKKLNGILLTISATFGFWANAEKELSFLPVVDGKENPAEEHEHVFTPAEEEAYKLRIFQNRASSFRFKQTKWHECADDPTGNYSGISCARNRQISEILKSFLSKHAYKCINRGLEAQDIGSSATDLHIVHDGILGDPRHSPRSMHAEARAIDIRAFEVTLTTGETKNIVYSNTANRPFYRAFRSCWGEVVNENNECPFYQGDKGRTGTIGWEDRNHRRHMHTSVPYCFNNKYGSYYYKR